MSGHFARIAPVVGPHLAAQRVSVRGLLQARELVWLLAASGLRHWDWDGAPAAQARLQLELERHHGAALPLDIGAGASALILAVGAPHLLRAAFAEAQSRQIPTLLVVQPGAESACHTLAWFPGDDPAPVQTWLMDRRAASCALDRWAMAAYPVAGLARGILLRHTDHARADLERLWSAAGRTLSFEQPAAPGAVFRSPPPPVSPAFAPPVQPRGSLLIVGLGSLGSLAALRIAPHTNRLILADSDHVAAANPARQAYPVTTLGQPKAAALARQLPASLALEHTLDEFTTAALLRDHAISAALVVTGTQADFGIARALSAASVPHVVGRCYPRARFWEATVVDVGLAPLDAVRGHLRAGPPPNLTPEQRTAYSDPTVLDAEPATLIESGWAAAWMARLACALLLPPALRPRWLLEHLSDQQNCFIGASEAVATPDGPAYGLELPGRVSAWQPAQIRGASALPRPTLPVAAIQLDLFD